MDKYKNFFRSYEDSNITCYNKLPHLPIIITLYFQLRCHNNQGPVVQKIINLITF